MFYSMYYEMMHLAGQKRDSACVTIPDSPVPMAAWGYYYS